MPICNGLCCVVGMAGVAIGISCKVALENTLLGMLVRRSSSHINSVISYFTWYSIGSLVILSMAFAVGIGRAGMSRKFALERISLDSHLLPRHLRTCTSPRFVHLVQALLLLLFILQSFVSCFFAVVLSAVCYMDAVCQSGTEAVATLVELSAVTMNADNHDSGASGIYDGVQDFCGTSSATYATAFRMFASSVCVGVSIALLLACVSTASEKIGQSQGAHDMSVSRLEGASVSGAEEDGLKVCSGEEHLKWELASQKASFTQLSQKVAALEELSDRNAAELKQEQQRSRIAEGELAELRSRAEKQLGKWRQSAAAISMAKWQNATVATNSTLSNGPNLQRKAYQISEPEADQLHVQTSQELVPPAPQLSELTLGRAARSHQKKSKLPQAAPSIFDLPSPSRVSSLPPSPKPSKPKLKRLLRRKSRTSQAVPAARVSDSKHQPVEDPAS